MADFIRLGTRVINTDHISCISETHAADPRGKGRKVRVDFVGQPSEYFDDDESLKSLDSIIEGTQHQHTTRDDM